MENKYSRLCPNCQKELWHTLKSNRDQALKKQTWCSSCRHKEINTRPNRPAHIDKFVKQFGTPENNAGEKNPFFGKHHSEETKNKLRQWDRAALKTDTFKEKMSAVTSGNKNPMFGKTYYDVWLNKYGKEIADQKQAEKRKKNSYASSGSKNPMFGKLTPNGAGNGWSGWYKRWFFRSLRELGFVVELDRIGKKWMSAEGKIRIAYIGPTGTARTYVPDFIVGNRVIEIKPSKLIDCPTNRCKRLAAEVFCAKNNLFFEMIDHEPISPIILKSLIESGKVKLTQRYQKL